MKRSSRRRGGGAAPTATESYILTWPGGRRVTVDGAEYARLRSTLPRGTMVQHPDGWFVIGASIGDGFDFD